MLPDKRVTNVFQSLKKQRNEKKTLFFHCFRGAGSGVGFCLGFFRNPYRSKFSIRILGD